MTLWCWFHHVISLLRGCFSVFRCMRSAVLHDWFPALLFCSAWLTPNDSVSEAPGKISPSLFFSPLTLLFTVRDKLNSGTFPHVMFHREPCHTHFSMSKPRFLLLPISSFTASQFLTCIYANIKQFQFRGDLSGLSSSPSTPPYRYWGLLRLKGS